MGFRRRSASSAMGASYVEIIVVVGVVALAAVAAFLAFGGSVRSKLSEEAQHVVSLTPMGSGGPLPQTPPGGGSNAGSSSGSNGSSSGSGSDPGTEGPFCTRETCSDGTNCFVAGTPVVTRDGLRPIEEIGVGDEVLSADESTGVSVFEHVVTTFVTPDQPLVDVRVSGEPSAASSASSALSLRATPGHRFYTQDRGWVAAASLAPDEPLRSALGESRSVESVRPSGDRATVFNLEVEHTHTYFVGTSPVLVHNWGCGLFNPFRPRPPPGPPLTAQQALDQLQANPQAFLNQYPIVVNAPPNQFGATTPYPYYILPQKSSQGGWIYQLSGNPSPGALPFDAWVIPTNRPSRPHDPVTNPNSATNFPGTVLPDHGPGIAVTYSQTGCCVAVGTSNQGNPIAAHIHAQTPYDPGATNAQGQPLQGPIGALNLPGIVQGGTFTNGGPPAVAYGTLGQDPQPGMDFSTGYTSQDRATVICFRGGGGQWTCFAQNTPRFSHAPDGTTRPPVLCANQIYQSPPQNNPPQLPPINAGPALPDFNQNH